MSHSSGILQPKLANTLWSKPSEARPGTIVGATPRPLFANGSFTEYSRVKVGFSVGVGFSTSIKNDWGLSLNLLFQQKGFSDWDAEPLKKVSAVNLNYLSVRQLLNRDLNQFWSPNAGIEESFLVGQRRIYYDGRAAEGVNFEFWREMGTKWSRFDLSFLLGVEHKLQSKPITLKLMTGVGIIHIGLGKALLTDEDGIVIAEVADTNAFVNLSVGYSFTH